MLSLLFSSGYSLFSTGHTVFAVVSQLSGVVSNAIESRIAISGLMPVWPFSNSESAFLLIPRAFAAFVIDNPSGLMQSSLIILPGMRRIAHHNFTPSLLVIVQIVNINNILFSNLKNNPPVAAYVNSPEVIQPACQSVKPQPRKVHISRFTGSVKSWQAQSQTICVFYWIPALLPLNKKLPIPYGGSFLSYLNCNLISYELQEEI